MFFILLFNLSFFQLQGMEQKSRISFNDIPNEVVSAQILPYVVPELFCVTPSNKKDAAEKTDYGNATILCSLIQKEYIPFNKRIYNIALTTKRLFQIIKLQYGLYKASIPYLNHTNNINDSFASFLLVELFGCYKLPLNTYLTFEKKTHFWEKNGIEEAMIVYINCGSANATNHENEICFTMEFITTSGFLPFRKKGNFYYIDKKYIKESTELKVLYKFFDFVNKTANSTGLFRSQMDGENTIQFEYYFDLKKTLVKKDAILVCEFLNQMQIGLLLEHGKKLSFVKNLKSILKK